MHLHHLTLFITLTAALPRIPPSEADLPLSEEDELLPSRPGFFRPPSQIDFISDSTTEFVDLTPRESKVFDFVQGCAMANKCLDADYGNLLNSDITAAGFCRTGQAALYDKINSCVESGCGVGESAKTDFQEDLNKSCARAIEIAERDDEKPTSTQTATKTASSSTSSHKATSSRKAEKTPSSTPTVAADAQETKSAISFSSSETSKPLLSTGAIVGIAVGGVALLALIALGLFLLLRRNRTHSRSISFEPTTPRPNSTSPPTKPTITTTWHSTGSTATTLATPLRSTPTLNTQSYPTISYTPASAPLSPVSPISPITPRQSSELDTASTHSSPQFAPLSQRPVPQPRRSDTTVWRAKVEGARDRASRGVVMGEQSIAAEREEGERERGGIGGFVKRLSSGSSGSSELFGSSLPKKGPGFLGKRDSQGSEKRKSSGSKDGFVIM